MNIIEDLKALPQGAERIVPWAELQPHFPGRTDRERWESMMAWGSPNGLDIAASDVNADRFGNITRGMVKFSRK